MGNENRLVEFSGNGLPVDTGITRSILAAAGAASDEPTADPLTQRLSVHERAGLLRRSIRHD